MSDLFYPYYETEYLLLEKYIRRRVKSLENQLDVHRKEEHFHHLHKQQLDLNQFYRNLDIIMHNLSNEEILLSIQQLYGDIIPEQDKKDNNSHDKNIPNPTNHKNYIINNNNNNDIDIYNDVDKH